MYQAVTSVVVDSEEETVTTHPDTWVYRSNPSGRARLELGQLTWRAHTARADILRHALTHSNYHVHNGGRSPSLRNTSDWPAIDRCSRADSTENAEYSAGCASAESVYRRICSSVISMVFLFACRWLARAGERCATTWKHSSMRNGPRSKGSRMVPGESSYCVQRGRNIDGH